MTKTDAGSSLLSVLTLVAERGAPQAQIDDATSIVIRANIVSDGSAVLRDISFHQRCSFPSSGDKLLNHNALC